MATFEEEFRKVQPTLEKWISFLLLGKKIEVRGAANFVRQGPNLIVGNHCGAFKDIAVIFRSVPRSVFFTANKDIFIREEFNALIRKHLVRHLGELGIALNSLIRPIRAALVGFVSTNISKVGTIPVDLTSGRDETRRQIQTYLEKGRAVVALQGRGRVQPRDPHPYVSRFRPGTAAIAYEMYRESGISVPVTPLAIYGSQRPWSVPGWIRMNVGAPMFVREHIGNQADGAVERFRDALEMRVRTLFLELIRD